ncbi:DUF2627 domain-containing protein [Thermaerobacillus caldiproteolyticus]|uniref:DUF2627 domain-containing protein n=1 Tax=Thermaerobacillus caldiproteolyticus TaxID=247480 RepID=A0A7V9Z3L3_9BACL|nr:DUF2627 domain-containing protein [Anoxybacillus caldiproteolyticus]MBA2873391.1 hypothetical protein [Anoxybacillus caldiproteolyticus]QPA33215.1 DUF2627 domain-containing protein [Anoxybacillus caldiproteolyticus]
MQRMIALTILLIPGFLAALGIKWMRDTLFGILHAPLPSLWLQFLCGFLLFALGLGFIGGFILHRDQKRNKVQPRFQKKQKNDPSS